MAHLRYHLMNGTHANDLTGRARHGWNDAAPQELAYGCARAEKLTGQIDGKYFVPLAQSHVCESGITLEPGIVDQNVNRTKLVHGAVEHFPNLVFR